MFKLNYNISVEPLKFEIGYHPRNCRVNLKAKRQGHDLWKQTLYNRIDKLINVARVNEM